MFASNTSQVSNDVKYIEDFFSAWLRTGTGSSQTVTTGIKENTGALVISKSRSAATDWAWYDTFRGATKDLASNTTASETTQSQGLTSFNTDGHTWGTLAKVNTNGATYVDFVLKPTPKFFDVVTYTGDGTLGQAISHNLGSIPGCIIIKCTSDSGYDWIVHHRSVSGKYLTLNTTSAQVSTGFGDPATSSVFYPFFTRGSTGPVNSNGATYVAYLFAHDAGGFGLSGTDNVISCGSYTGNGSATGPTITLGYEPQFVMVKASSTTGNWVIEDVMRGMSQTASNELFPNTSGAETALNPGIIPNATGFSLGTTNADMNSNGVTYIYIAIRRGPMKTPTSGTSVFQPYTSSATNDWVGGSLGYRPEFCDLAWIATRGGASYNYSLYDRLRGFSSQGSYGASTSPQLITSGTAAETTNAGAVYQGNLAGLTGVFTYASLGDFISYSMKRAPGFFDEVCYTGTSAVRTVSHNLGAAPELMLIKQRNGSTGGVVYAAPLGTNKAMLLFNNQASAAIAAYTDGSVWSDTAPTASVFTLGNSSNANTNTYTYVAYLFASCPGVSKVGSYTGTGATQQINCGFTAGARFVLIKRTDNTGDWYVWDTARGIVAGNDPYLLLNSTAAEVTTTDYVDTYSAGFEISSTAPAAINANGGSFIYLAIA